MNCTSVSRPYDAAKLQDVTVFLWRHIVGRWRRRRNCSASAVSCGIPTASHLSLCAASILQFSLMSDAVCKLQVAIIARSSREVSQTVRIDWPHILSRVRVSIRLRNVFIRKNCQNHKCDACFRTFPTQRGLKIHAARCVMVVSRTAHVEARLPVELCRLQNGALLRLCWARFTL